VVSFRQDSMACSRWLTGQTESSAGASARGSGVKLMIAVRYWGQ